MLLFYVTFLLTNTLSFIYYFIKYSEGYGNGKKTILLIR